jgi:hypothetical protein
MFTVHLQHNRLDQIVHIRSSLEAVNDFEEVDINVMKEFCMQLPKDRFTIKL